MIEDVDEWKSPYDDNFQENPDETNDLNFEEFRLSTFHFWPVSLTVLISNNKGESPFSINYVRFYFILFYLTAQITSRHITISWLWIFVSYGR